MWRIRAAHVSCPQAGLHGCGLKAARNIAAYTPLGYQLVHTYETCEQEEFCTYLDGWRSRLRDVLLSATWLLGCRYCKAAEAVTETFLPISVLQQYVRPVMSLTTGSAPDAPSWVPRVPALVQLAVLCRHFFLWGDHVGIQHQFCDRILPGMCMCVLIQVSQVLRM